MRYLYCLLLYLALPYVLLRLWLKSKRLPAYRERLSERFGFYSTHLEKCIWIHAVSVGEVLAAIPLIKALQKHYPQYPFLVTTMTPTGALQVQSTLGNSVQHVYLPYDFPGAVSRFLKAFHPIIGLFIETELWPNLIAACHRIPIPLCLLNARLSATSAKSYRLITPITQQMLKSLDVIATREEADAKRFIELGATPNHVSVTGNIKFDLELPHALAEQACLLRPSLGGERFIWIAGSTHEGEEDLLLSAHKKLREKNSTALFILVPRHPDRFDEVATLCEKKFAAKKILRRSQHAICTLETAVYLGDTMGELLLMYAVADVAFIGGSLIPKGGHNLVEPASLIKPMLTGPYLFNFNEMSELFISANVLIKISDVNSLAAQLIFLMEHPIERQQMGERAAKIVKANRGALEKQVEKVVRLIG